MTSEGWSWCRYCEVAWSDKERISLSVLVERFGKGISLPVAMCSQEHKYTEGKKVAVAFCKLCRIQHVLVKMPDQSFCLPPHKSEDGIRCEGSNEPSAVLMMRTASDMDREASPSYVARGEEESNGK